VTASFRQALAGKDFVVTVELPLSADSTRDTLLRDAARLSGAVDGFVLTDNQYGGPHMSPAAAAGILLAAGHAPILQLSCRNRNRIALIGELLGARATGIDTLMLVRGGVLPEGYSPRPKAVGDTDPKELIATAKLIDEDEALGPANWLIGTSATVHLPAGDARPEELLAKADAGAKLIIAQICHDVEVLRHYMAFLVASELPRRLSIIISIAVPTAPGKADWLRQNRRGTVIPDHVVADIEQAHDPEAAAIANAASLLAACREMPGVCGVNFAAIEDPGIVLRVLDAAARI